MGLRSRKPWRTILETNLLLRLAKSKRKRTYAQSLTITEPRNFLRLELEIIGGVQPHFCPWKNVFFPICPHGEKWEKSIWKEREKYSFPSLSICFFLHFSPWGKMGKKVYGKRGKSIHFPLFLYTFFPIFPHGKNGKAHIFP